jgi:signal transduction histidine kinase
MHQRIRMTDWSAVRLLAIGVIALPVIAYGKNVVVLHTENSHLPANAIVSKVIQETIGADQRNQIFEEYLDENRLGPNYPLVVDALRRKYGDKKIDLVLTFGPQPYGMLMRYGQDLWPTTPIVFSAVDPREISPTLPPNITGVTGSLDFSTSVDLALSLQPDLKHVFYIGGATQQELGRRAIVEQDFKHFANRLDFAYLNNLPLSAILEQLASLPPQSMVLFTTLFRDAHEEPFVSARVCSAIADSSRAPVYGVFETYLGCGIIGGAIFDIDANVRQAAAIGIRILNGEPVKNIPVETGPPNRYVVDWRQLKKWGISERNLPRGTTVMYRETNVWISYKKYILIAIAALSIQSALIVLLVIHMRKSKRSTVTVRRLTRRLIKTGEQERSHIARELHDDLGQRLSLVAVQLAQIHELDKKAGHPPANDPVQDTLDELDTVISDVHNLSHNLHSTKLEHLGLHAALNDLCHKFTKLYNIPIHLASTSIPSDLAPEIALSFYRVAQEALYNAVKHSTASMIQVSIGEDNKHLRMIIKDNGIGFKSTDQAEGLGLATMEERMSIVGGSLSIASKPSEGTTISVQAPFRKRFEEA